MTVAQLSNELCLGDPCPRLCSSPRRLTQWARVCWGWPWRLRGDAQGHKAASFLTPNLNRAGGAGSWGGINGNGKGQGTAECLEQRRKGTGSRYSYRLHSISITSLPVEINKALCNLWKRAIRGFWSFNTPSPQPTPSSSRPLAPQRSMFELKHTRDSKHSSDTYRSQWTLHTRANVFVSAFAPSECVRAGCVCFPDKAVHLQMLAGNWSLDEDCFLLQRVQVVCTDLFPGPTLSLICSLCAPEVSNLFPGAEQARGPWPCLYQWASLKSLRRRCCCKPNLVYLHTTHFKSSSAPHTVSVKQNFAWLSRTIQTSLYACYILERTENMWTAVKDTSPCNFTMTRDLRALISHYWMNYQITSNCCNSNKFIIQKMSLANKSSEK